MMVEPWTDSVPAPPLESFSRPNTMLPIVIPATNNSIQAASTHRRRLTQKRAVVANMSPSQAEVFADVGVPVEPGVGELQLVGFRTSIEDLFVFMVWIMP